MNEKQRNRRNPYGVFVYPSLYITSYTPLFFFIILRQVTANYDFIYTNFSLSTIVCSIWLSISLLLVIIIGLLGTKIFLTNIKNTNDVNGTDIRVIDIENKNSETLSYIGTYIIPFMFQNYNSIFEVTSIILLLLIIFPIYMNSSLIQINPLLNIWYSIYEIDYVDANSIDNSNSKRAIVLIKERRLEENDILIHSKLDNKLFFAKLKI
jgi:hypothetical protein